MAATDDSVVPTSPPAGQQPARRGLVVAILGPDGAGKSTVVARLVERVPNATTLYAGLYPAARARDNGVVRVIARLASVAVRARWHRARGRVVLLDRHPYDVAAAPPATRARTRLRRSVLGRLGVRPDLLLVLDAAPALLHARKQEQTPEQLDRQRQGYLALARSREGAVVVDAAAPLDEVVAQIASAVDAATAA